MFRVAPLLPEQKLEVSFTLEKDSPAGMLLQMAARHYAGMECVPDQWIGAIAREIVREWLLQRIAFPGMELKSHPDYPLQSPVRFEVKPVDNC